MAWITPQNLKLLRKSPEIVAIAALGWVFLQERALRIKREDEFNAHLLNDAKDFREDVYRIGALSQKTIAHEKDTVFIAYPMSNEASGKQGQ